MHINSGIIQGSGVGPHCTMLWRMIYVHFSVAISFVNMLMINLIVPGNSDIGLHNEFSHSLFVTGLKPIK